MAEAVSTELRLRLSSRRSRTRLDEAWSTDSRPSAEPARTPAVRSTTSPPPEREVPPFVGLTGGIGAGKSTALAALERLGAAVLSTDAVVHELYREPEVEGAVVARFGDVVAPGGVVDRAVLAEHAFATDADTRWLEHCSGRCGGADQPVA